MNLLTNTYKYQKCSKTGTLCYLLRSVSRESKIFPAFFEDILLIPCYYSENYSKKQVEFLDEIMVEGPYGYVDLDSDFDVRVKIR